MRIMNEVIRYYNAQVVQEIGIIPSELFVKNGKIVPPQDTVTEEIDCEGRLILPGLIDLQVNGGFGIDITSTPEKWTEVAAHLVQYGITSFLPTIISQPLHRYVEIFTHFTKRNELGAECLGLHLEGPFLNVSKKGAHSAKNIQEKIVPFT